MALFQYDPHEHINSDASVALDESERMQLVRRYHRRQRIRLPNETIHAAVHVIVRKPGGARRCISGKGCSSSVDEGRSRPA